MINPPFGPVTTKPVYSDGINDMIFPLRIILGNNDNKTNHCAHEYNMQMSMHYLDDSYYHAKLICSRQEIHSRYYVPDQIYYKLWAQFQ